MEYPVRSLLKSLALHVLFFGTLLWTSYAHAEAPSGYDPSLHSWFESLFNSKLHMSCCGAADCARHGGGEVDKTPAGYVFILGNDRILVPPEAVLDRTDNPTGQYVICYAKLWPSYKIKVICLIRPPEA